MSSNDRDGYKGLAQQVPNRGVEDNPEEGNEVVDHVSRHQMDVHKTWDLKIGESVYGGSTVFLMTAHNRLPCLVYTSRLLSWTFVLLLNNAFQYMIMHKVYEMTVDSQAGTVDKLLGSGGLCRSRNQTDMPIKSHWENMSAHLGTDEDIVDCSLLTNSLLSNSKLVDADHDGRWSLEEAHAKDKAWSHEFAKSSNLNMVHKEIQKLANAGHLEAQKKALNDAGEKDAEDLLKKWASTNYKQQIPFPWLQAEQNKLDLCIAIKPPLCGNLELRGILEDRLGKLSEEGGIFDDVEERIMKCKDVLGSYCPKVFGELFKIYSDWSGELCGSRHSHWDKLGIIYTSYSMASQYIADSMSVTSRAYLVFMFLILFIWFVSMLSEIRKLFTWWIVLIHTPTTAGGEKFGEITHLEFDKETEDIYIKSIPLYVKAYIIIFNLAFRTYMCLNLPRVGASFLIGSDDFTDLILNSCALAFLIEIDEMLFMATADRATQKIIDKVQPLRVDAHCPEFYHHQHRFYPTMCVLCLTLMSAVSGYVYYAYASATGKWAIGDAVQCLCHVEGDMCLGAQILGGNAVLNSVVAH